MEPFVFLFKDYLDAFEKLQKLNFKEKQGREIIHVVLDCCLQVCETFNNYFDLLRIVNFEKTSRCC